jgi:hypothetical protein
MKSAVCGPAIARLAPSWAMSVIVHDRAVTPATSRRTGGNSTCGFHNFAGGFDRGVLRCGGMQVRVFVRYVLADHEFEARCADIDFVAGYGPTEIDAVDDLRRVVDKAARTLGKPHVFGLLKDCGGERIVDIRI